eukprot:9391-Heterococcus_DN1.PRE.1
MSNAVHMPRSMARACQLVRTVAVEIAARRVHGCALLAAAPAQSTATAPCSTDASLCVQLSHTTTTI